MPTSDWRRGIELARKIAHEVRLNEEHGGLFLSRRDGLGSLATAVEVLATALLADAEEVLGAD